MQPYDDFWDVDSGNSPGTYDTEAEALEVVRILIEGYGPDDAAALDLGYSDDQGNDEAHHRPWDALTTGSSAAPSPLANQS